jgi:septation ring formation regulator EzrA
MSKDRTAEILRYVSAMAREFGEHRQEMKEFRQEFNELRQEFNEFRKETNSRLDRVDKRLDGLEDQFQVFKVEQRQAERHLLLIVEAGVTTKERVDDLQHRVASLEGRQP